MLIAILTACLFSFSIAGTALYLNRRLCAQIDRLQLAVESHHDTPDKLRSLSGNLLNLENRFETLETSRREQAEWAARTENLNLNRRGQVLRLHRRGDTAVDIAKSLQLGVGEVALIIKVFEMGRANESGS